MPTGIYIRTKPAWNKGKEGINKGVHIWANRSHPMLGKKLSEKQRKKISLSHKGKHYPKLSEALKKAFFEGRRIPWNKGKKGLWHPNEEQRRKLSLAGRGIKWTEKERLAHMELLDLNCPNCNKLFHPRHIYNKCCSKKCAGLFKRKGVYKQCIICGKEFYIKQYAAKNKNNNCCSKLCRGKWWAKKMKKDLSHGRGNKLYKSGRRYEYKTLHKLYAEGFQFCTRSAGSKGIFDVWAFKIHSDKIELSLIQVKGLKNTKTFKKGISRKERAIMLQGIEKDNFKWADKKFIGVPKWAGLVNFEVWIWNKGKECNRYRLNLKNKEWILKDNFKFGKAIQEGIDNGYLKFIQ